MLVTVAVLAEAGVGESLRWSVAGTTEAVFMLPAWTVTVFTVTGLIGSVEPSAGAAGSNVAGAAGAGAAVARKAAAVCFFSSGAGAASATSTPSATGGAVRLAEAILMLLSIRLVTLASRAEAVRPPNTTAMTRFPARAADVTMLKPEALT